MPVVKEVSNKGLTVIICCYNSAGRIHATLQHLANQVVPSNFNWEILVINNASTDNTKAYAAEVWESFQFQQVSFTILDEPTPGQVYARKAGVAAAQFENLVFCDDDNWLGQHYVWTAFEAITKDPVIGAAGGQNLPVTDIAAYPEWFEEYKDKYATGIPAKQSGNVSHRGFVLGAGLVTRRSLFRQMYDDRYPSLLNGRNGEKLSTGDDFEYCKRLLLRGYTLYYDSGLLLEHFIPKERLTVAYRDRLMEGIHEAGKVLGEYDRAIYLYQKNKQKSSLRLLLLTPFRILLAKCGWSSRNLQDEMLTLYYLSPFDSAVNPVRRGIKKFLYQT